MLTDIKFDEDFLNLSYPSFKKIHSRNFNYVLHLKIKEFVCVYNESSFTPGNPYFHRISNVRWISIMLLDIYSQFSI